MLRGSAEHEVTAGPGSGAAAGVPRPGRDVPPGRYGCTPDAASLGDAEPRRQRPARESPRQEQRPGEVAGRDLQTSEAPPHEARNFRLLLHSRDDLPDLHDILRMVGSGIVAESAGALVRTAGALQAAAPVLRHEIRRLPRRRGGRRRLDMVAERDDRLEEIRHVQTAAAQVSSERRTSGRSLLHQRRFDESRQSSSSDPQPQSLRLVAAAASAAPPACRQKFADTPREKPLPKEAQEAPEAVPQRQRDPSLTYKGLAELVPR